MCEGPKTLTSSPKECNQRSIVSRRKMWAWCHSVYFLTTACLGQTQRQKFPFPNWSWNHMATTDYFLQWPSLFADACSCVGHVPSQLSVSAQQVQQVMQIFFWCNNHCLSTQEEANTCFCLQQVVVVEFVSDDIHQKLSILIVGVIVALRLIYLIDLAKHFVRNHLSSEVLMVGSMTLQVAEHVGMLLEINLRTHAAQINLQSCGKGQRSWDVMSMRVWDVQAETEASCKADTREWIRFLSLSLWGHYKTHPVMNGHYRNIVVVTHLWDTPSHIKFWQPDGWGFNKQKWENNTNSRERKTSSNVLLDNNHWYFEKLTASQAPSKNKDAGLGLTNFFGKGIRRYS